MKIEDYFLDGSVSYSSQMVKVEIKSLWDHHILQPRKS